MPLVGCRCHQTVGWTVLGLWLRAATKRVDDVVGSVGDGVTYIQPVRPPTWVPPCTCAAQRYGRCRRRPSPAFLPTRAGRDAVRGLGLGWQSVGWHNSVCSVFGPWRPGPGRNGTHVRVRSYIRVLAVYRCHSTIVSSRDEALKAVSLHVQIHKHTYEPAAPCTYETAL